jgi:hypothetical protein
MRYAQLDENNIVIGTSDLHSAVDLPYMIPIDGIAEDILGKKYENGQFVDSGIVPPEPPKWITVGAFKDRLGINALALAVSTNPICTALREMMYDRAYIDLERQDLAQYLQLLVVNNLPEARPEFPGSGPLTQEIVDNIITAPIQQYERP